VSGRRSRLIRRCQARSCTGRPTFEWLEGERFLIWRERADHPDFPDAIVIIGDTDGLQAHSFDSRGVHPVVETRISDEA
jgi:hypothetical protein